MASTSQRNRLRRLMAAAISQRGLGAVEFQPVPSGKVWGAGPGYKMPPDAVTPTQAEMARRGLENWLRRAWPELADLIIARMRAKANRDAARAARNGMGQTEQTNGATSEPQTMLQKLVSTVQELAPAYLQYKTQKDILDVQLDRARAGLPPLQTGEFAPSVQIGLDRETVRRIANEAATRAGAGAKSVLESPVTWVVGGVAAFVLFRALAQPAPRRRRAA